MPIIESLKGAYTAYQLHYSTPFYHVLELWEALCFRGVKSWIEHEPPTYDVKMTPEILQLLAE